MLPLWIIDITDNKSINRRDEFVRLVGKIANAINLNANDNSDDKVETTDADFHEKFQSISTESKESNPQGNTHNEDELDSEEIQAIDRKRISKELKITGNYWYYTHFENPFVEQNNAAPENTDEEKNVSIKESFSSLPYGAETQLNADILYKFQTELLETGKRVMEGLRESSVKPYEIINIVILGDVREEFTQMVFPSLATILQKEKGRILPHHIHQGMEIVGMLYIPCDANTYEIHEREKILLTLKEIEVQHTLTSMRGYDHMLLYQNVQNRTEKTYPKLTDEQQAEYVIQCLINLYFACDSNHPLFRGTASAENFYMTIGATSIHFDMTAEDEYDNYKIAKQILDIFKKDGKGENINNIGLLNDRDITPSIFISAFDTSLDMDVDLPYPHPHPIHDYDHKYLKRSYYSNYLKYFPAMLKNTLIEHIADASRIGLQKIAAKCRSTYSSLEGEIYSRVDSHLLQKVTLDEGGLTFIESQFKDLQDRASKLKNIIQSELEKLYWHQGIKNIPENLRESYDAYHELYKDDIKRKNNGRQCEEAKHEAEDNLVNHLKQESTTLGRISHGVMLGIIAAIAIVPILSMLSPWIINLGHVKRNFYWWALLLFVIPIISEFISYYLYSRKKKALINTLKAYYLHDAYARIANRIEFETKDFYDKLIKLSEEYIKRCKAIRTEVFVECDDSKNTLPFPKTMFNQPLNGGEFDHEVIIRSDEMEKRYIRVNFVPKEIDSLENEDYFLLLHTFHCEFRKLFSGILIHPSYERRLKSDGTYEFVTSEMFEKEDKKKWENIKKTFSDELKAAVGKEMRLRENPTVGEEILHYFNNGNTKKRGNILEPMVRYAATNGEVTSEYDTEFADIKGNKEGIKNIIEDLLPTGGRTTYQIEKYNEYTFFTKYFFVTRWRSFEHFSFNRILPCEDFDKEIQKDLVFKREDNEKKKSTRQYKPIHSSLILWSVCPDKSSPDWFTLFDSETFGEAYLYREIYREKLNPMD